MPAIDDAAESAACAAIDAAVKLHYNTRTDELIAEILDKPKDDPYVKHKAGIYRNDFPAFWGWLDGDCRRKFARMALEKAGAR